MTVEAVERRLRMGSAEEKYAYVYILSNGFKRLYIGVTTEIEIRMGQHKHRSNSNSHTAKYNITQLVYYEKFVSITSAIAREKQLKGWLRGRKLELIIASNPTWLDLSKEWGKPIEPFDLEREEELIKPARTFSSS
jgi:putative endonuclease